MLITILFTFISYYNIICVHSISTAFTASLRRRLTKGLVTKHQTVPQGGIGVQQRLLRASGTLPISSSSSSYQTNGMAYLSSTSDDISSLASSTLVVPFPAYLTQIKDSISNPIVSDPPGNTQWQNNVIMGNEAGDADSIVSALCLSYVKALTSTTTRKGGNGNDNNNAKIDRPIPIVSIPKDDMKLRVDVINLLHLVGINEHDLLYLDDKSVRSDLLSDNNGRHNNNNRITLVDHNKLRSDLWQLEHNVVEIIDHHADEGYHTSTTVPPSSNRDIAFADRNALVGSTCTLVTERLRRYYDATADTESDVGGSVRVIDPSLGLALLGVILLDTVNMNEQAGKGTPRDERAIRFLIERTDWNRLCESGVGVDGCASIGEDARKRLSGILHRVDDGNDGTGVVIPDQTVLYNYLSDSRFDESFWEGMEARDALRIDYKEFEASRTMVFGMSSVLLSIPLLLKKNDFDGAAIRYMNEKGVDFLAVLSNVMVPNDGDSAASQSKSPRREILLIGLEDTVDKAVDFLLGDPTASFLEITAVEGKEGKLFPLNGTIVRRRLAQGNPKGSRKQVAPILRDFFS